MKESKIVLSLPPKYEVEEDPTAGWNREPVLTNRNVLLLSKKATIYRLTVSPASPYTDYAIGLTKVMGKKSEG